MTRESEVKDINCVELSTYAPNHESTPAYQPFMHSGKISQSTLSCFQTLNFSIPLSGTPPSPKQDSSQRTRTMDNQNAVRGIAQALLPRFSPKMSRACRQRYSICFLNWLYHLSTSSRSNQPSTTAKNEAFNILGGLFVNLPQAMVQAYGGVSPAVLFQVPFRFVSLGVAAERQPVKHEEIPRGHDTVDAETQSAHQSNGEWGCPLLLNGFSF